MPKFALHSILVPMDGSASAAAALRLALRLVSRDGRIFVGHAIDRATIVAQCTSPYGGDPGPAISAAEFDERDIFARAVERGRAEGIRISTLAFDGSAIDGIRAAAAGEHVDAIAMGTHGRGGFARIMLGNTAIGVIGRASLPVFIVPEHAAETSGHPLQTVLAALDSSPAARSAARAAVDLAAFDSGRVIFLHAASDDDMPSAPSFASAVAYARTAGVPYDTMTAQGHPAEAIVNAAAACRADVIAIGAHGKSEAFFGFGSVAQSVVLLSGVPVLVVPARAVRAGARPVSQYEDVAGQLAPDGHVSNA